MESQGSARQPIYEIVNFFLDANVKYDMILVGGAGLVEGGKWNTATTGWKLPFNKQIFVTLDKKDLDKNFLNG